METIIKQEERKKPLSIVRVVKNYSSEEDDLQDPAWDRVKLLSSDAERYKQVKDCWRSKTIPNPNKNLTYHSFRKRRLNFPARVIKQCKRKMTHCEEFSAKRQCTYPIDDKITSIIKKKETKTNSLIDEMFSEMSSSVNKLRFVEAYLLRNQSVHLKTDSSQIEYKKYLGMFQKLWDQYLEEISKITHEYKRKASKSDSTFLFEISGMNVIRNEVMQFNNFYQGLGMAKEIDPTILTSQQSKELNEIEDIFKKFDHYYKI